MGQEYGHAYEELLDLALLEILTQLSQNGKKYRISPKNSIKGVSGNIDHLIEIFDNNDWKPWVLFLEKHSDSIGHSLFAFRRHLEEYVQAKVASVLNFGFSIDNPLYVINLLYGKRGGWADVAIQESKRLLNPTIYLVEQDYYDELNALVEKAVHSSFPSYKRELIRENLINLIQGTKSFQSFKDTIWEYISSPKPLNKEQKKWIENEIIRTSISVNVKINQPNFTYIRRTLTELIILDIELRNKVVNVLQKSTKKQNNYKFPLNEGFNYKDFLQLRLSLTGSNVDKSLIDYQLHASSFMNCFPVGEWIREKIELIEDMFFNPMNPYKMDSCNYLVYFDIRDRIFPNVALEACYFTIDLLMGNRQNITGYLMKEVELCSVASLNLNRVGDRRQNIYLEAIMSIASYSARIITGNKFDLSSPKLAKSSKISRSIIDEARYSSISELEIAEKIVNGILSFYEEIGIDKFQKIKEIIENEIQLINNWKNWDGNSYFPEVPNILNPENSMSLTWSRHNQLNSHQIYNPLLAIIFNWASCQVNEKFKLYGFPNKRSANPLQIILGKNYEGTDYEFSILFWNLESKHLKVFESSSVINFKHTSDKCKELCAKIRIIKASLANQCQSEFCLIVDGDWRESHIRDLIMAGWDTVIYSRDFIENFI